MKDYLALFKQKPHFKDLAPSLGTMWIRMILFTVIAIIVVPIIVVLAENVSFVLVFKEISLLLSMPLSLFLMINIIWPFLDKEDKHDYILTQTEQFKRDSAIKKGNTEYPYLITVKQGNLHAEYLAKEPLHGEYADIAELKSTSDGIQLTLHEHVRVVNSENAPFTTASIKDSCDYLRKQLKRNTEWFKYRNEKA